MWVAEVEFYSFLRFRKRETRAAAQAPFKSHTDRWIDMIDWTLTAGMPGDFTFDSYFTNMVIRRLSYQSVFEEDA